MRTFLWLALLQAGTAVMTQASAQSITTYRGLCDASAAVALGNDHFVVGDDEANVLSVFRIDRPDAVASLDLTDYLATRRPSGKVKEADIEGSARIGNRIYWISSHGRNKKGHAEPARLRLFFTYALEEGSIPGVALPASPPFTGLLDAIALEPRFAFLTRASRQRPESPGGLNIEGLAATPDGRLLIGFRNPRPHGKALVLPLRNPADVLERGARPVFDDLIALDLGGRGIRSLERLGAGYGVVGGPFDDGQADPSAADFALYTWGGLATDAPVRVPGIDFGSLRPEALFGLPGRDQLYLLSDDGGMAVDGLECKKRPDPKEKTFRGLSIPTPAALKAR